MNDDDCKRSLAVKSAAAAVVIDNALSVSYHPSAASVSMNDDDCKRSLVLNSNESVDIAGASKSVTDVSVDGIQYDAKGVYKQIAAGSSWTEVANWRNDCHASSMPTNKSGYSEEVYYGERGSINSATERAVAVAAVAKLAANYDARKVAEAAALFEARPVPEFLYNLLSILREPAYSSIISWSVPTQDEPSYLGGGMCGIGKIVVHQPKLLQEHIIGRYWRHNKYASFQRQLNNFGFRKKQHCLLDGQMGIKRKLDPCSYVHPTLTADVESLLSLKRRSMKRKGQNKS